MTEYRRSLSARQFKGPPIAELIAQSDDHVAASARLLRQILSKLSRDEPLFEKSVSAIEESLVTLARSAE